MQWLFDMKDELKISTEESFRAMGLDQPQDQSLEILDKLTQAYSWLIDVCNDIKDDPDQAELYENLCEIETALDETLVSYHQSLR